jgi:hypothetical protein
MAALAKELAAGVGRGKGDYEAHRTPRSASATSHSASPRMRPAPLTGLPGRYRLGIADCRYWAGRVALRENPRARTRRLAGPRGSEATRLKINLLKSSRGSWPGGDPLRPVPGVPPRPRRGPRS